MWLTKQWRIFQTQWNETEDQKVNINLKKNYNFLKSMELGGASKSCLWMIVCNTTKKCGVRAIHFGCSTITTKIWSRLDDGTLDLINFMKSYFNLHQK